jgi:hypothetical protein
MRLADYTADDRYFELNPNSGGDFRLKLSPPRKDRLGYAGMGQMLRPKKDKSSPICPWTLCRAICLRVRSSDRTS